MLELTAFLKAINSLESLIEKTEDRDLLRNFDPVLINGLKAGVIRNFEFTYELSWKYIKRWLEDNFGSSLVDGVSRRQLFRLAFENLLIEDVDLWMDFHISRNRTSHTYNFETAEDVYKQVLLFLPECKKLYKILESKND